METMMIFTSIYGVVDGFFVANYVGETPFDKIHETKVDATYFEGEKVY